MIQILHNSKTESYKQLKKIIIIEWSDKLKENRSFDLKIKFEHINNQREIEIIDKNNLFLTLTKS